MTIFEYIKNDMLIFNIKLLYNYSVKKILIPLHKIPFYLKCLANWQGNGLPKFIKCDKRKKMKFDGVCD